MSPLFTVETSIQINKHDLYGEINRKEHRNLIKTLITGHTVGEMDGL